MSDEKKIENLSEEALEGVSGGMTPELKAAYACIQGVYGNGQDRVIALRRAGYDPNTVQYLVNAVLNYEGVARDVINGKYGNGNDRVIALRRAGYPPEVVQTLVNHMLF